MTETNQNNNHIETYRKPLDTTDYALIAQCSVLIVICSWISVPTVIPFTMQTFAVFLSVGLLGGKRGTISVLIYLLLGMAGVPVFSGLTGGLGYMMGATGGYIIGFVFSALTMWALETLLGSSHSVLALSMVCGLLVCYAFGTFWFVTVYSRDLNEIGFATALGWCVLPFVFPDTIKIVLAMILCGRIRSFITVSR